MIEVGDIVQITNRLKLYSTYSEMADVMDINDTWRYNGCLPLGVCIGRVITIKPHTMNLSTILYAVLIDGQSYIMDEDGIELKSKHFFDDDLFEL